MSDFNLKDIFGDDEDLTDEQIVGALAGDGRLPEVEDAEDDTEPEEPAATPDGDGDESPEGEADEDDEADEPTELAEESDEAEPDDRDEEPAEDDFEARYQERYQEERQRLDEEHRADFAALRSTEHKRYAELESQARDLDAQVKETDAALRRAVATLAEYDEDAAKQLWGSIQGARQAATAQRKLAKAERIESDHRRAGFYADYNRQPGVVQIDPNDPELLDAYAKGDRRLEQQVFLRLQSEGQLRRAQGNTGAQAGQAAVEAKASAPAQAPAKRKPTATVEARVAATRKLESKRGPQGAPSAVAAPTARKIRTSDDADAYVERQMRKKGLDKLFV